MAKRKLGPLGFLVAEHGRDGAAVVEWVREARCELL